MNLRTLRLKCSVPVPALLLASLVMWGETLANEPGRLFYTPAQRAQLEAARARNVTQVRPPAGGDDAPPAQRFDGMVIRSDGRGTSWVNGQPQTGASGVPGLKPGQIRADGKVYEPYQVLRPSPPPAIAKEPTP
jgi:hypothetical protein